MTRASVFIVLGLLAFVAVGQLSISTPTYVNMYSPAKSSTPANYYDTGSYQVYTTSAGYSVASESTGFINVFDNSNCVGTNTSQFFCIDTVNNTKFNQINLTTGQEFELFQLNQSITSLAAYYNNIHVFFDSYFSQLVVINPPTQTPVCTMNMTETSYNSALYFEGQVMTTPDGSCYNDCSYSLYNCSSGNATDIDVNVNTSLITFSYYYTQIMFLQSGNITQIIGFPSNAYPDNQPELQGYMVITNQTYYPSLGNYTQVGQINATNILILNNQYQLQQYQFNFDTLTFTQVGSTLSVPSAYQFSISPISNTTNQVAIVYSDAQGGSNFYVNLNAMTVTSWIYNNNGAQNFTNGTVVSITTTGYFLANGTNVTYQYDSTNTNVPATFTPYNNPPSFPNNVYALVISETANTELFNLNLEGTAQPTYTTLPGSYVSSSDQFVGYAINGSEFIVVTFNYYYDNMSIFSNTSGNINTIDTYGNYPMVFINISTNVLNLFTNYEYISYSTLNWTQINDNSDYINQFDGYQKLTETQFIAWYLNNSGDYYGTLNISVINGFTLAVSQTYLVSNVSAISGSDITVIGTVTSAGNLQALYVSSPLENALSQNWIIYPDNSNYTGNVSTVVIPGQGNTALFCNSNFDSEVINCTQYSISDGYHGNVSPAGSSGGSGTVIIIILVIIVLLAAGFFIRRNMLLKKAGGAPSGIAMAKV